MRDIFWFFVVYSFFGFLLEVAFTRMIHAEKKDRKCFFLLPLCPVYGAGAAAILLLPESVKKSPPLLLVCGAAAATAVEFGMGLFYEKVMRVKFWDYTHLPGNLGGRICLLYTGIWGLLALALVYLFHPLVADIPAVIPDTLLLPVLLFMGLDGGFTIWFLRRKPDTGALRWYRNRES